MRYAVSLVNFAFHTYSPSLERAVGMVREQGYGIELRESWREEQDFYDEVGSKRLKHVIQGMDVSLHGARGAKTIDLHKKQIDAAAELGAKVIVIHPQNILVGETSRIDLKLCGDAVAYAAERGVRLALENVMFENEISLLANTAEKVDGLGICLDVGHVYSTSESLKNYLDALKERIIHLHLHDRIPEIEQPFARVGGEHKDHCTPGTGSIPIADWELLLATLKEIDFRGMAVFEDIPRSPLQNAVRARNFLQNLLQAKNS